MVSLMGNTRYGGGQWGSLPCSELSDFTFGQEVERIQQEEQYRQEMMRQRQELHRRQMDLYQRLQVPQYLSQDRSSLGSTWSQPMHDRIDSTWHKQTLQTPTFGTAPVVRNPSTSSNKDLSSPLTVDCSVEYELPDFLKVSTKEGPPLLMKAEQNKTSASCLKTENREKSAKERATPNYWSNTKDSSAMLTQSLKGTERCPQQSHKIGIKRKYSDVNKQDCGMKRQKMMALTPPDLITASHALSTSTRWPQTSTGGFPQPYVGRRDRRVQPYQTKIQPAILQPTIQNNLFPGPSMYSRPDPMLYGSTGLFPNPLSFQDSNHLRFESQMFSSSRPVLHLQDSSRYSAMYPQYPQNQGCIGCIRGLCQRIY